jgi:hypothetical protein
MNAIRSAQHLARAEDSDLFLCRQISGVLALEQEARQVLLKAGDFALLNPLLAYSAKFSSGSKLLVLKTRDEPWKLASGRRGRWLRFLYRHPTPNSVGHRLS